MRYILRTLQYTFKNFFLLSVGAIFPALIWGFFNNGTSFFSFVFDYYQKPINNIGDILNYIMNIELVKYVYPLILFLVAGVLCVSLLVSAIENHMRLGKYSYKQPLKKLNSALPAVIPVVLVGAAVVYLWEFLLSCVLLLNHAIFSHFGQTPNLHTVFIALAIILIFLVLLVYMICFLMMLVPTKLMLGYPLIDTASYSVKLYEKKSFGLFLACLFPFIILFFVDLAMLYIPQGLGWISIVVQILTCFFAVIYYTSLPMVCYFEFSGMERKDRKVKYYEINKGGKDGI